MELKLEYKQTELGIIPDDWNYYKFGDVISKFSSGSTPSRRKPEYYNGNIRWITSGELNYNIISDTLEKITEDAVTKSNLKIIPKGTFLFAITGLEAEGTRGSCGIVGADSTTNQSCMALFPTEELISQYLFHFYVHFGNWLAFNYCQGTKQQSYTTKIAKLLPIILPPTREEQSAIAEALDDTDELISSLEKLIEKKRNVKKGTMQQLLNGRQRLSPFNKSCIGYKKTELGLIPSDWELVSFGIAFKTLRTATYSRDALTQSDDTLYIHYGDIHTKFNNFIDFCKATLSTIPKNKEKNYSRVLEGDLIMVDASEDYTAINKSVEAINVGSRKIVSGLHTILLRDFEAKYSNGFRGYITSNSAVKSQFDKLATGMKVYGVSKNNLKKIFIPTPPTKAEQSAIAEVLRDMDSEIETLEKKRDKYISIKQGMMQELLTGKIRLV